MTDEIEVKQQCPTHGELLLSNGSLIKKGFYKGRQTYRCKLCMKEIHKNNYLKNKEKINAAHAVYRNSDIEKFRKMRNDSAKRCRPKYTEYNTKRKLAYDKAHPEQKKTRNKRHKDRAVEGLFDWYVKRNIIADKPFKNKDVTPEMVEMIRIAMDMKRKIKRTIKPLVLDRERKLKILK